MKASRLLSIMMLLQARGRITAPALARALEVSERTILRDIDQLCVAGVPIWGDRGRAGGFQLRPGWSTALTGLTEPEVNALFLAGLPGPATELGLGSAATSARLKMVASLPAEWREQADRVASRLHIDPVDWYRTPETPAFLREAAQAVWQGTRIAVQYESWRGVSQRELEPLGLVLKAGAWYLIAKVVAKPVSKPVAKAVAKPAPLTFRLANIQALTVLPQAVRRPAQFDLARHWQASLREFEGELHRFTAHIAVSPRGIKWLANERTQATRVPEGAVNAATPPGWQEFLIPIESVESAARQLLAYGAQVKVLGPGALAEAMATELGLLNGLYEAVNRI